MGRFQSGGVGWEAGFREQMKDSQEPEAGQQCAAHWTPLEGRKACHWGGSSPSGKYFHGRTHLLPKMWIQSKEGRRNIRTNPLPPANLSPPICQTQAEAREPADAITGSNSQVVVQS